MKTIATCIILSLVITTSALTQSKSFLTLKEKFSNGKDVYSFSTSGLFARTILWMAGEHEFNDAIKSIKNISLITVPKSAFKSEGVTVSGFKKVLREDSFEELVRVKDHGDDVTMYIKPTQNRNNRYIILVEEYDEVVVIELKGYVDPDFLLKNESLTFANP